ncbi:MAG: DNA mismatch repair protein MutS, partial [Planctomycetota bacterium]
MVTRVESKKTSPAMAQYHRWKQEHPDEILFFQMGDFFEMFYEDARTVSRDLGLTLTSRSKGADAIPMAGVPVKSVDLYLKKLVGMGHRVAICDQIQDPREADGVVDRAVTRIVTAGTITEEDLLDRAAPNYLAALEVDEKRGCGLAFLDLSTGEFRVSECSFEELPDVLSRLRPAEILVAESAAEGKVALQLGRANAPAVTTRPDWQFERSAALETISGHYGVANLDGFGLDPSSPAVVAAGAALAYLIDTQKTALTHLSPPRLEAASDRLVLDRATRSCLELTETSREGRREGTLLSILDQTHTAMGARRMREWLLAPLLDVDAISSRQTAVEELVEERPARGSLRDRLKRIADIERLMTRVVTNRAGPRDLVSLRDSLGVLPDVREILGERRSALLGLTLERLDPLPALTELLRNSLVDEPPATLADGGVIRDGFNEELDELRSIRRDGRKYIAGYQSEEIERTGISNLRVGYNRVFGFYIEVTNSFKKRVPDDYVRKQTLKNAERYITPRLKEYETRVLGAEDSANHLEIDLFQQLRQAVT